MRAQIAKTKSQYQHLLDSGKIDDPRKMQQMENIIATLEDQLKELESERWKNSQIAQSKLSET